MVRREILRRARAVPPLLRPIEIPEPDAFYGRGVHGASMTDDSLKPLTTR
jgi:hypothetical protein